MKRDLKIIRIQAAILGAVAVIAMQSLATARDYEFPTNQPVPAAFKTIISILRTQTSIPILLPMTMVGAPNTTVGEIIDTTFWSYTVQMSMGTSCHKGMYCRFGTLHGESISTSTPPLTGTPIAVKPGIIGYYTTSVCAANCNESTLSFRYDGYQYTVGIEAGAHSEVLRTAQSLAVFGAPPRFNPLDVVLRLSSDKPTYNAGEAINLRAGLWNIGSHDLGVLLEAPWHGAKLIVTDSSGAVVNAVQEPNIAEYAGTHGAFLGAGKTVYLSWAGEEWASLDDWGYRLRTPGTYTITGIPTISGNYLRPETTTVRSNTLQFKILGRSSDAWGPISDNLQMSISTQKNVFEAGKPIAVDVDIRNLGPMIRIQRFGMSSEYQVVCGQTSESDDCVRRSSGLQCSENIPGYNMWQLDQNSDYRVRIDIASLYDIAPGTYSIRLESPIRLASLTLPLPSNTPIADLYSNPIGITVVRPTHVPKYPCNPTSMPAHHQASSDITTRSNTPRGHTSEK